MTRTARAAYPRALVKDAHESRSGLDNGMRKQGAGHHNWGSLADEHDLETQALDDENVEEEETSVTSASVNTDRSRCKSHLDLAHGPRSLMPIAFLLSYHVSPFSCPGQARPYSQHQRHDGRRTREGTSAQEERFQEVRWYVRFLI